MSRTCWYYRYPTCRTVLSKRRHRCHGTAHVGCVGPRASAKKPECWHPIGPKQWTNPKREDSQALCTFSRLCEIYANDFGLSLSFGRIYCVLKLYAAVYMYLSNLLADWHASSISSPPPACLPYFTMYSHAVLHKRTVSTHLWKHFPRASACASMPSCVYKYCICWFLNC